MEDDELSGTWVSPKGPKVTFRRDEGGTWHTAVFFSRRGKTPVGEGTLKDIAEVREKIEGFESDGYVRVNPGEAGPPLVPSQRAGMVMLWLGLAALVVFLILKNA